MTRGSNNGQRVDIMARVVDIVSRVLKFIGVSTV